MMTTSATSSARDIIRSPFTPNQWQELEHQALIFKYIVSGVPVPPELIYSVKRSLDSSLSSRLFPHQPIGWGCFQVGFGRKADPEPGRCRRTDGKKWRCSKEAYPDSKYCEKHMHRGRNRSRKPVEITSFSSSSSSTTTATLISSTSPNISSSLLNRSNLSINNNNNTTTTTTTTPLSTDIYNTHQDPTQKSTYFNPFLYPQKSTYASTGFSSPHDHNTTHQLFLDSGSCSDKDYRYFHGTKEGVVDERDFFPEASGSVRGIIHQHDSCQPLMTNSFKGYSHDQSHFHQSFSDNSKPPQQQQQHQQQQHCFVLGTDFKSSSSARPLKIEKEEPDDTQKQLHHFFGEWPPKNTDSWLDLASNSRVHNWYYSSIMDSYSVQKSPCLVGHQ